MASTLELATIALKQFNSVHGKQTEFGSLMQEIRNAADNIGDDFNIHLTNYIKKSMISSRVFIQKSIVQEPILNDVLGTIQQLYLSWVLTAINMNNFVAGGKTIRNMLDVVATESFLGDYFQTMIDINTIMSDLMSFGPSKFEATVKKDKPGSLNAKASDVVSKEINITYGRIVEVTFNVGNGNTVSVNLFIQLFPTFVEDNVMGEFLSLNYKPDWRQRFFQVQAGELSFWKDFLFELDLSEKRKKALKNDNTGVFKEMLNELNKNETNRLKKMTGYAPNKQNIANTIHIFEKDSFNKFCHENRIDFKNQSHRDKYFSSTMSMMVVVIDPSYERVEMYFAGISNRAEYNYIQLQNQNKNSNYDLVSVMKAFANTSAPRF